MDSSLPHCLSSLPLLARCIVPWAIDKALMEVEPLSRSCIVEAKRHVSQHRAGLLADDKTRFGVTNEVVDSNQD